MFIAITLDNQMTNILSCIEDSSDFPVKPSAEKNYFTNHILNGFFFNHSIIFHLELLKTCRLIKWHIYEAFMLRNGFVWPCIHIATKL